MAYRKGSLFELDREASKQLRDEGVAQVTEHNKDWVDNGADAFFEYIRQHGTATLEQWRDVYLAEGGEAPAS